MNFEQAIETIEEAVSLFKSNTDNNFRICIILCDQLIEALSMSVIDNLLTDFAFQSDDHNLVDFEKLVKICKKDMTEKIKEVKKLGLVSEPQQRCITILHNIRNVIHHYKYDQNDLFSKISSYTIIKIACEMTKSITEYHIDASNHHYVGFTFDGREHNYKDTIDKSLENLPPLSEIVECCNHLYDNLDNHIISAEQLFNDLNGNHDISPIEDAAICGYISSIDFFTFLVDEGEKELILKDIDEKINWLKSNEEKFSKIFHIIENGRKHRHELIDGFVIENIFSNIYEKSKLINYLNNSQGGSAGISIIEEVSDFDDFSTDEE